MTKVLMLAANIKLMLFVMFLMAVVVKAVTLLISFKHVHYNYSLIGLIKCFIQNLF